MKLNPGIHEYDRDLAGIRLNFLLDYKPKSQCLILFLHGLACTRNTFSNIPARRSFGSSSLLLPDFVGHGKSAKPADFSYAMEDQAALIEQIVAGLGIPRLHIVAHSMGAAVALLFSPGLYARVKTFANLEGNLIDADCGMLSRKIVATTFKDYKAQLFPSQIEKFASDKLLEFDKTTPLAVYRSAGSLVEWSDKGVLLDRFLSLECKKAYFWGEHNHDMPVLGRLGPVRGYKIPGSGHGMMVDNPEEFYQSLSGFIYS